MRVKISYGIEIEKVPETTKSILEESSLNLSDTMNKLKIILLELEQSSPNLNLATDRINEVRESLSEIDLTLGDVQSILLGLQNYYDGEKDVPERRPTMDPSGNNADQT